MKAPAIELNQEEVSKGASSTPRRSGLRKQITVTYILVTLASVAILEITRFILFLLFPLPPVPWPVLLGVDASILVFVPMMGAVFSIIATRKLLQRIHNLTTAATMFANGHYEQRLPAVQKDEIGQLEHDFNQMVEQLAESTARQRAFAEQEARHQERARLARDLHDSVKQQVFAVNMQIGAALMLLDDNKEVARTHLLEAETLVQQAQEELTVLIHELRPVALQDDRGLATVLQDYAANWSHQHNIAVDIHVPETCLLPLAVEEALLRITQEALSNIARHSQATRVQLSLLCEKQQVTLSITDNGRGFDPASTKNSGVGLYSMQERMLALKGSITIESKIGEGTHLTAQATIGTQPL